ncbi:MAG: 4Fe-4S dicluster domain-containing protein [Methanobacteriaceae archaeon]|jgi:heterodisulfide reductase subunit C|nr:4Fe-4S dicluster domain-containing protein [Methanobacteriaceae archaeon]
MSYGNDKDNDKYSINLSKKILNSIEAPKDLDLLKCIQCGMCTSLCPAAAHTDYNPRDLIADILNNNEIIIKDEKIWNCFYCYTCQSVCPVKNSACLANQVIRQLLLINK